MADIRYEFDFTWQATMRKATYAADGADSQDVITDHVLLQRFRCGEQDAATQLYLKYAARLQSWASSQTSAAFATRFDEEDVVQSVFRTLFRRVSEGLYDVPPGEELWQLLLVIALNKIRKLANHHRAQKRDVVRTCGSDVLETERYQSLTPDETSMRMLQIVLEELFEGMTASNRSIVQLRIEGYKTNDIADQTGRSSRTVERTLQAFRKKLSEQLHAGVNSN